MSFKLGKDTLNPFVVCFNFTDEHCTYLLILPKTQILPYYCQENTTFILFCKTTRSRQCFIINCYEETHTVVMFCYQVSVRSCY